MTSAIIADTIDADFPVAGQDNDSQGFRDNFSVIKDGLATAKSEITVLQDTTAKLDVGNDFNGNLISNAQTNQLYGTVYSTTSTGTTNVSLADGEYQAITVSGNHTVTLTDWPETDLYAKIRLALTGNGGGAYNVTFATEGGGAIKKEVGPTAASATGARRTASSTSTVRFSFPTANITPGTSFVIGDKLFGTGLTGSVTITNVTNLTNSATQTYPETTLRYTAISSLGQVTTSTSAASIITGTKVKLSDVTGISGGLAAGTTYYAFGADGSGFRLASSYANAIAGTAVTGITGSFSGPSSVAAGSFVIGQTYTITNVGDTDFTLLGASSNTNGVSFVATGAGNTGETGTADGRGTARFPELNDTNSNAVNIGSTTGMYVGMPVRFTGTDFGGLLANTDYFIIEVITGNLVRLSLLEGGDPVTLTSASGTLTLVPRTTLSTSVPAQTVTSSTSTLTLTTSSPLFPNPFTVDLDPNKTKIVEAWTVNGGTTVFMKYLGEFA